jgi:hypothetical protein
MDRGDPPKPPSESRARQKVLVRNLVIVTLAITPIVFVSVLQRSRSTPRGGGAAFMDPLDPQFGKFVSLAQARAEVPHPLAQLPSITWPYSCRSGSGLIRLFKVKSLGKYGAILSYSHGLLIRVSRYDGSMLVQHRGKSSKERVRGQLADAISLGPGTRHFFGRGFSCDSNPWKGNPATESVVYNDGAALKWREPNLLFLEIEGPYSIADLKRIAKGIRFDPD